MSDQGRCEKIGLASDNFGNPLKQQILDYLTVDRLSSVPVLDLGTFSTKEEDCEEVVGSIAKAISFGEIQRGILAGATAHGMSMFANKFSGVQAVIAQCSFGAELARLQFDANLLCLGQFTTHVERILRVWLRTPFENQNGNGLSRHARRVAKIAALEEALNKSVNEPTDFQITKWNIPILPVVAP